MLENGHKVIIGPQRDIPQNISKIKNCYWFDKNSYINKIKNKQSMQYKNFNYIGMLDEEGPVAFFNNIALKTRYPKEVENFFNYIFLWGKKDLLKLKYISKKKLFLVGNPKYDLLKYPYLNIWNDEVKNIKKKFKKIILFNSSFRVRKDKNHARRSYVTLRDNLNSDVLLKNALKKIEQSFDYEDKNYNEAVELFKNLAIRHQKYNFIFRPHPNENIEETKRRFGKIPSNLKIIYKYSATPWIIACDVFIHSGCTTSLEAAILKKNIVCFIPNGKLERYKIYSKIGYFYKDSKKCLKEFNKFLKSKKLNKKLDYTKNLIENYKKDKFFFKSFLQVHEKLLKKKINSKYELGKVESNSLKIFFYLFKMKIKKFLSFLKDNIIVKSPLIYLLKEKYIYDKLSREKKIKYIKRSDITRMIKKISLINKKKFKLNIKKITENVFILARNR